MPWPITVLPNRFSKQMKVPMCWLGFPYILSHLLDDQENDQVNSQINTSEFNTLEDVITFCNEANIGVSDQVDDQVIQVIKNELNEKAIEVLQMLKSKPHTRKEILKALDLSNHTYNKDRYIDPLKNLGWIVYTIPENPTDRNQKYKLSAPGIKVLKLLNK